MFMRANILAYIPPQHRAFRDAVQRIIPCFRYGATLDSIMFNTTNVARDVNHGKYRCICKDHQWSQYTVVAKDGSKCLITTNAACLQDDNAAAVLNLQAGFRAEYAEALNDLSFFESLIDAIESCIGDLCHELKVPRDDIEE
ncbi:unnamed protein product [Ectocarpus sp. CCAP 1310/34]|nr:unnamed protein product [Ectocarpus sp. CCAP 1310/34]